MSKSLNDLNELSDEDAQSEFLKCCGSEQWARRMKEARPFANSEAILANADKVWWALSENDWLEAFRAHPKIGEQQAAALQSKEAQAWSAHEQSGIQESPMRTKAELAAANKAYEQRFGFIFIVCATGKSAEEMLSILNQRLQNDRAIELRIAAEEQRKITQLRLRKLLESLGA
jgi:OHCU decarboxylase